MFADDTALISSGNSAQEASSLMERDLNIIGNYLASLKLKLNVGKTKIMNIDRKLRSKNSNGFGNIVLGDSHPCWLTNHPEFFAPLIVH